ncbi:MAG: hypothetical protein LUQ50_15320 [Methanospirillum sp.]|uniref:hypothetical protein n=1 Tax=Methanospirillum sp. TaxID=45200 RepID=UPI002375EDEC|nr:hypothetical protein [Methanospirillum sp.]MDD1730423.1 hypothetical protein [Methanospirillum sp.]
MITELAEVAVGVSLGFAVLNGFAVYHLYRQYRSLAEVSFEFASKVLASIREEDGEISTDPVVLAGETMDHLIRVSGMVAWIRDGG